MSDGYDNPKQRIDALRAALAARQRALQEIIELTGVGFADIVVANTVLGRIKQRASVALRETNHE